MSECKNNSGSKFNLTVSKTEGHCPIGEKVGEESLIQKKIPVLSCEGACIRGEIARLSANYVAKNKKYQRGCHGELFTVPNSNIAKWIKNAEKVVCIDGCFLKCHSRIMENIIDPSKLVIFDALSFYKKYNDIFDIDDVPEEERKEVAKKVSEWVLKSIEENKIERNESSVKEKSSGNTGNCGCGGSCL